MFHWLSEDIVRFKIELGVKEKTLNTRKMAIPVARRRPTRRATDDAIITTYINTNP